MKKSGHLHIGYLQLLLGYGIHGLIFFHGRWAVLLQRIRSVARRNTWRLIFYGSSFFFVVIFLESYVFCCSAEYVSILLMGIGYTSHLAKAVLIKPAEYATS